ncbi:MAG: hypothetical protein WCI73_13340, partial [Phycisphaerae bacterium]
MANQCDVRNESCERSILSSHGRRHHFCDQWQHSPEFWVHSDGDVPRGTMSNKKMFHVEHCKLGMKTYRGRPPFLEDRR